MQEVKNLSIYRQSLRDRILETAISLFMKNGIRAVKMDDIANVMSESVHYTKCIVTRSICFMRGLRKTI